MFKTQTKTILHKESYKLITSTYYLLKCNQIVFSNEFRWLTNWTCFITNRKFVSNLKKMGKNATVSVRTHLYDVGNMGMCIVF